MIYIILVVLELVVLITSIYFGYQWSENPAGNYEPYLFLAGLFFVALEIFRRYEIRLIKREGKKLTPGELIKHSEELRKQVTEEIYKCRKGNLRKDVIIRHVNRMDAYPEVDDKEKGISPWFRAGLLDTYHRGILLGLRFATLTVCPDGYRHTNYKNDEKGDVKVYLVGKIQYSSIEGINFDGDEYYNYPHIFCHFDQKGEPYEELVYCEEIEAGHGHVFYSEVAPYKSVRANSIGYGSE